MKAWLAAVGGALGGLAVWRLLRRRPSRSRRDEVSDPRAEELRTKLEESKPLLTERAAFEEAETPVDAVPDPESRRRAVHDAARARIDELSGSNEG